MPLGCGNSLPLQVGGSPTRFEKAYTALQRMVGKNGYSTDDNEIEALWRQAKADAMACLETFDERAALQASPLSATDHIPLYENEQKIVGSDRQPDEDRRQAIATSMRTTPESWTDGLLSTLRAIEPNVEILMLPWENLTTTQAGRWYAPFEPTPNDDFGGGRLGTQWPSFSDAYRVIVHMPLSNGAAPNVEQRRKVSQIQTTLYDVVPGWHDFRVIHSVGFILDESCLDITAFGT